MKVIEVPHRPYQRGPSAKAAKKADVADERRDSRSHDDLAAARLSEVCAQGIVEARNRLGSVIGLFELRRVVGHDDPLSDPDDRGVRQARRRAGA